MGTPFWVRSHVWSVRLRVAAVRLLQQLEYLLL